MPRNEAQTSADLWITRYTEMKSIYLHLPPRDEQDRRAGVAVPEYEVVEESVDAVDAEDVQEDGEGE